MQRFLQQCKMPYLYTNTIVLKAHNFIVFAGYTLNKENKQYSCQLMYDYGNEADLLHNNET